MIRDYSKSVGDKIGFLIQALFREHVFFHGGVGKKTYAKHNLSSSV